MNQMNWVERGLLKRLQAERGLGVEWTDEDIREHNAEKGWDIVTEDRSTTQHVMLWADELAAVIRAYRWSAEDDEFERQRAEDDDIPY